MSPNLRQHLNRFVRAAIDHSWSGGAHPEDRARIQKKWLRTRINFHKRLSKLEAERDALAQEVVDLQHTISCLEYAAGSNIV